MSAPDARADSVVSVLIAYRWPCAEPAPTLPSDVMACWPPGTPLAHVPRATGYICRRRITSNASGRALPSGATAVTFFKIMATDEETQQFARLSKRPIVCRGGDSIVVWGPLASISFDQLRANKLRQVGLCKHLQDLKATGVLFALQGALRVYLSDCLRGQKHKGDRRKNKPRFA